MGGLVTLRHKASTHSLLLPKETSVVVYVAFLNLNLSCAVGRSRRGVCEAYKQQASSKEESKSHSSEARSRGKSIQDNARCPAATLHTRRRVIHDQMAFLQIPGESPCNGELRRGLLWALLVLNCVG